MECYERTCCVISLGYLDFWDGACQRVLEYIFCGNHLRFLERVFGGRKTNADGGVAMKTPEDEAFDELARRQGAWGGGYQAKRQAAMDKINFEFDEEYIKYREAYREAFFKGHIVPHQEPVAWMTNDGRVSTTTTKQVMPNASKESFNIPLFTTPPKREWVGLSDEDRKAVLLLAYKEWECEELLLCAREDYLLIEQALKDKNT
jgi:hypothetical protein